ncbi:MAG: sigma-70 family RNA polymerase sigma factor [Ilumatobacteraceae bacterium]
MTTDADLVVGIRAGETSAAEELYVRYLDRTRAVAQAVGRHPDVVDDLVAESFTRVLESIHAGRGPVSDIGSYLAAVVRHLAVDRFRRGTRLVSLDDVDQLDAAVVVGDLDDDGLIPDAARRPASPIGSVLADFERRVARTALDRLAPSVQEVLLHTVVNGETAGEAAAVFGVSPPSMASRAYRARERLRQEYLSAQVPPTELVECARCADLLGAYVRGALRTRRRRAVEHHLGVCESCRQREAEVRHVNGSLPGTMIDG